MDDNEAPDDSIASALASAIAQHETPAEGAAEAAKPAQEAAPAAKEPAADDAGNAAGGTDASEPADNAAPAAEAKPGEAKPAAGTDAPAHWKAAEKEEFKQLPDSVKQAVLRREKERDASFTKKTQEIADFKRRYDPVEKYFDPYRQMMKDKGWTEAKLIEAWGGAEKGLMQGGESAEDIVAGIVRHYQVNMGNVARKLGLRPRANGNGAAPQPADPQHQNGIDLPSDHPVLRQLQTIQARIDAADRAQMDTLRRNQTAAETRVMSEIEEFKSAVDDAGNLLHPHFEELESDMTRLAQSANASGKPMSLKDLYEAAQWANPSTREATLAALKSAQQAKDAEEARAKAAAARKAGSSVTGAPGSGQAPTGKNRANLSLREQLEASFADTVGGRI